MKKGRQDRIAETLTNEDFLKVPYPVTTTSSSTSVSGFNTTFKFGLIATS